MIPAICLCRLLLAWKAVGAVFRLSRIVNAPFGEVVCSISPLKRINFYRRPHGKAIKIRINSMLLMRI